MARFRAILGALPALTPEGSRRALLATLDASLAVAEPHDALAAVAPVRGLLERELAGDAPSQEERASPAAAAVRRSAAGWSVRTSEAARMGAWDSIAGACFAALEQELGI